MRLELHRSDIGRQLGRLEMLENDRATEEGAWYMLTTASLQGVRLYLLHVYRMHAATTLNA